MKITKILFLAVIIGIGAFLRLYKLDILPQGLYVDEAVIGYNAYSFLETGRDEFGKSWPIFLRSYGTFPSPLYTYLSILSVKLFGLSIFSTRFLSALSGTITILFIYLILDNLKIFKNRIFPFIGALIFATSPWSIFFSRGAFESNLALMIFSAAIYCLILAERKTLYLIPTVVLLALSTYTYQSERLIAFILLAVYLLSKNTNLTKLFKNRIYLYSVTLFVIIQLPQLLLLLTPAFSKRASGLFYAEAVSNQTSKLSPFLPIISYPLSFLREFLSQYFVYFSPRNLFFLPDEDLQRQIPELSTFYPWMVIPYLMGVYVLVKNIKNQKFKLLFILLLVSPIPAALTRDPFSTLRALPLIIPLVVIITLGIEFLVLKYKVLSLSLALPLVILSGILLWRSYFVFLPAERAKTWDYGYEQLAEKIKESPSKQFVVDQTRTQPSYIILAFYLKYPPDKLQNAANPNVLPNYYRDASFYPEYKFANLQTRNINWENDIYEQLILVGDGISVSSDQAKEHFLTKSFTILDPLGRVIFQAYETHPDLKCKSGKANQELCHKKGYI